MPEVPLIDPALAGRACDEVGCDEVAKAGDPADCWQVLDQVGLVLCDEHRVCEACCGEGYQVWGDQEWPCPECSLPYPEY